MMASHIVTPSRLLAQPGRAPKVDEPMPGYPAELRRNLASAVAELRCVTVRQHAQAACLLGMAENWISQTERDIARAIVSEGHTAEFLCTLNDALAMLAGAVALSEQIAASQRPQRAMDLVANCISALPACAPAPSLETVDCVHRTANS